MRRIIAAILLLLPVSACGFHPLYSEQPTLGYDPTLAAVVVHPAPDRAGQIMVATLREELNPRGVSVTPRYDLTISMTVSRSDLGIQRDNTSTRGELTFNVALKLTRSGTERVVWQDSIHRVTSFNLPEDAYAATVAEENARTEAADDLGREIAQRLAIYLRQQPSGANS